MKRAHGTTPLFPLGALSAAVLLVAGCAGSSARHEPPVVAEEKVLHVDLGGGVVMEFVRIEPGTFLMGSPEDEDGRYENEGPQTRVAITKPFYLGKYELTQAEWTAMMGGNPSAFQKGAYRLEQAPWGRCPVEQVSWDDCQEFIKRLNDRFQGRRVFRLPTEAEWEYACRAGTTGARYGELDGVAWYTGNSGSSTHRVGEKKGNAWGVHDMLGNVWEWCGDWYGDYPARPVTDPPGPSSGSYRVFRGGSWDNDAGNCRTAVRNGFGPGYGDSGLGLRLATSAP
ncbi:MAG: formylglycine-generating enzyme family protein [Planctomycetes bacterium]|nr:formylglycine-generating enzyme family protein [Planctomycetota bacterium]